MVPVTFVGTFLAVSLLGAGWSWVSARRLEKRDASANPLRQRIHSNWLLAAALFAVVTWLFDADQELLTLVGLPSEWPWSILGWAGVGLGAALVGTVSYLGAFPVAKRVRDSDMGALTAAGKMFRYQAVLVAMILSMVIVYRVDIRYGLSSGALTAVLFATAAYLLSTPLVGLSQTTTEPDADTQRRLDRLQSRVGLSVTRTRLLDGNGYRSDHLVRGPVGRKTLFVTDSLLERYDDDIVAAILAVEAERTGQFTYEAQLLAPTAFGGLVLSGLAPGNNFLMFAAIGVLVLLVGAALNKRLKLRADDAAAEQVGHETLADALEATVEEVDRSRVGSAKSFEPSYESRIERLKQVTGES
ncbi:peptidase [Haloferax mediterranei ATCC 33500]|uniref:Peptidase n=1 Tax=Haloferax mediterranei (strain ATCC 33500 / DSM 1411 / JCM 8866 / NBRC 14739 / NCIMB 2177 / R-4) TaxID=523841 RepID=I3R0Z5_HALMT|nr:hypothetical protein [Haloferax mediterranei]AFK17905.1 putative peptidase [Haloferax mediterranei ATCC 33500]AHZ22671.1 peptidase [Haloferax mediterranei ATCC 33500]EMA02820.1 putative peptidase [Haloferax mediterranei ATCC 33500]MDX5987996.1 peptidase [Haloferax mediterranei ATCC 33500]QCQ74462.1 peptidase [Haloferax mediterranei ATCC 33500]